MYKIRNEIKMKHKKKNIYSAHWRAKEKGNKTNWTEEKKNNKPKLFMVGIQRKWFKRKDQTISYSSCVVCSGYCRAALLLHLISPSLLCCQLLLLLCRATFFMQHLDLELSYEWPDIA